MYCLSQFQCFPEGINLMEVLDFYFQVGVIHVLFCLFNVYVQSLFIKREFQNILIKKPIRNCHLHAKSQYLLCYLYTMIDFLH